jgi:hypothetical protein
LTRPLVLTLLTVDGVLSALAGALLLPLYLGSVPFPISAVVCGLLNAALVWAALQWTPSTRLAAAPLWAFLATVLVLTFGGPGGDAVFRGPGIMDFRSLLFIVVGVAPPAVVLWRAQNSTS